MEIFLTILCCFIIFIVICLSQKEERHYPYDPSATFPPPSTVKIGLLQNKLPESKTQEQLAIKDFEKKNNLSSPTFGRELFQ